MNKKISALIVYSMLLLLVSGCATDEVMLAPDTRTGDQLDPGYLVGQWCNNRELTSNANSEAGHSAVLNLGIKFWNFKANGNWQDSGSGWMYSNFGEWQLQGRDTVILDPIRGNPTSYQASFTNSGVDLYLKDKAGQFLVLSRCD